MAKSENAMQEGFFRRMADDLDDPVPPLVYADWLEESGDKPRADFIRLMCKVSEEKRGSKEYAAAQKEVEVFLSEKDHLPLKQKLLMLADAHAYPHSGSRGDYLNHLGEEPEGEAGWDYRNKREGFYASFAYGLLRYTNIALDAEPSQIINENFEEDHNIALRQLEARIKAINQCEEPLSHLYINDRYNVFSVDALRRIEMPYLRNLNIGRCSNPALIVKELMNPRYDDIKELSISMDIDGEVVSLFKQRGLPNLQHLALDVGINDEPIDAAALQNLMEARTSAVISFGSLSPAPHRLSADMWHKLELHNRRAAKLYVIEPPYNITYRADQTESQRTGHDRSITTSNEAEASSDQHAAPAQNVLSRWRDAMVKTRGAGLHLP